MDPIQAKAKSMQWLEHEKILKVEKDEVDDLLSELYNYMPIPISKPEEFDYLKQKMIDAIVKYLASLYLINHDRRINKMIEMDPEIAKVKKPSYMEGSAYNSIPAEEPTYGFPEMCCICNTLGNDPDMVRLSDPSVCWTGYAHPGCLPDMSRTLYTCREPGCDTPSYENTYCNEHHPIFIENRRIGERFRENQALSQALEKSEKEDE